MQETAQQFQAAEEARVVASKEAEESKHEMEVQMEQVVETQEEAEVAAEVAEKEEQLLRTKNYVLNLPQQKAQSNGLLHVQKPC